MTPRPLSLIDVALAIARGEATPLEMLERCLDRLGHAQASGAFVVVDEDGARRAAARLPTRPVGGLHGVPVAVKDLVDVAGLPTAAGRGTGPTAVADAAIVARLRAAGAVIVGKTRTDELGLGAITPGACDPRDPARSPGGSSGGSAIAVASGVAALAVATDTAGSARIPAAACGVTGLCPSPHWVSRHGVVPLSPSCDRVGLIAASPADAAFAWRALAAGAVPPSPAVLGASHEPPAWTGRVAVLDPGALGRVDPERVEAAVSAASRLSAAPVVVPGPAPAAFGRPRGVLVTAEAAALHRASDAESPLARLQLEAGAAHDPDDVLAARAQLAALGARLRDAAGDGVLVLPTLPSPPPCWRDLGPVRAQLEATGWLTRLCGPVNTSGLVAISAPAGADAAGRPIGVQIVAAEELTALAAARRLAASG